MAECRDCKAFTPNATIRTSEEAIFSSQEETCCLGKLGCLLMARLPSLLALSRISSPSHRTIGWIGMLASRIQSRKYILLLDGLYAVLHIDSYRLRLLRCGGCLLAEAPAATGEQATRPGYLLFSIDGSVLYHVASVDQSYIHSRIIFLSMGEYNRKASGATVTGWMLNLRICCLTGSVFGWSMEPPSRSCIGRSKHLEERYPSSVFELCDLWQSEKIQNAFSGSSPVAAGSKLLRQFCAPKRGNVLS